MTTFLIALASFVGFIVAYHTYGRWIARRVFGLDANALVPSKELEDGVDYVPSQRSIVFGHHFTSIAGTGPIVGPAIAVFWGWLPALLWVIFGSIFIGAVHDFGALVVSMRNRGQTVGEIAGRLISPRTKILFLFTLFFALTVVLAIFGLVIAVIFKLYPESVLAVWVSLPIAVVFGLLMRRGSKQLLPMSVIALILIYFAVYVGAYHFPISIPDFTLAGVEFNSVMTWTIILLVYCAIASVLPVWLLLQPRDYVNSHQLFVALALLMVGLLVACFSGQADLFASTEMVTQELPLNTPPIWPFLFITIACGAVSGFHCLVSSGTSSKQLSCETDAQAVGYGSMLLEGALAVVVILACCAGVGMGKFEKANVAQANGVERTVFQPVLNEAGQPLTGSAAWRATYKTGTDADGNLRDWSSFTLGNKVGAFVDGGANFLSAIGIPLQLGVGLIAVLVACFAATTLDSATRLQRYVIQELAGSLHIKPLKNMYLATLAAVVLGGWIALMDGPKGRGSGGLLLWPLFGATNQLLAGLAFMVTTFYLWRRGKPVWFVAIPMVIMIILPAYALCWQLFNSSSGWFGNPDKLLVTVIGVVTLGLQAWMVVEAVVMWPKAKGVIEEALPPIKPTSNLEATGGRSC